MKDFIDLVLNRQACRDFNDKPLEKELVEKIANTAVLAPSACNSQPWKLYCVTSPEKVEQVALCLQNLGANKFTSKAKAFIAVSEVDAKLFDRASKILGNDFFVKYDIGQVLAYITLGAQDLGVSSCVIGWVDKEKLKQTLSLPDQENCSIVVALGYSDTPLRDKIRKEKSQTIVNC